MDQEIIFELAAENEYTTVARLIHLYWGLSSVLMTGTPGDVVELGCNAGLTTVLMTRLVETHAPERRVHAYDSFEGLPLPGDRDRYRSSPMRDESRERSDIFGIRGAMSATVPTLRHNFERWSARPPEIHQGWFHDTLPSSLPEKIGFAYLDSDLYDPIMLSLTSLYPRLSPGAIVMVDDYADIHAIPNACNTLPAVYDACSEFLRDKPERMYALAGEHEPPKYPHAPLAMGYFRKE